MIIKRQEKSSHYYLKDGTPFYEIQRSDGKGLRPVRVTDAFKVGAYRSVTNVLGTLDKPGLDAWKQEQCVLSALTLPRFPAESEHDFAERVMLDADQQSKKAREDGERLHELSAIWVETGKIPAPESQVKLLGPFTDWCRANLFPDSPLVRSPESVMVNHQHGYAGRVDLPVRLKDGSIAIIDLKTQDVKHGPKGPKPDFYDEWPMQLAAYSRCQFADGSYPAPMPWRLISLVIDRKQPGCYPKEWTDPVNPLPSSEPHFQAFLNAGRVWTYLKGGTPGVDLKAA